MPASYYVYYRVLEGLEAAARATVLELLERVAHETGVRGRLLSKRGDPGLWMEVYESVATPESFERALQGHVSALSLERHLMEGRRHLECFEACA